MPIAQNFGRQVGMPDNLALHETGLVTMHSVIRLLTIAPWTFRILVGGIEVVASLWCFGYRFYHKKKTKPLDEVQNFEKLPLISGPLLQVYRSLAAMAWFEHPLVQAYYGIYEKPEEQKNRFGQTRNKIA